MNTDQRGTHGWLCSHRGHSTGECGPMCECTRKIARGEYGKASNPDQQRTTHEGEHEWTGWCGDLHCNECDLCGANYFEWSQAEIERLRVLADYWSAYGRDMAKEVNRLDIQNRAEIKRLKTLLEAATAGTTERITDSVESG